MSTDTDAVRVLAGECTVRFEGSRERTQRGRVVVVIKPDRTTLVHDADGYQPVAWLTRPDSLTVEADADAFGVTARTDDQRLRVVSHSVTGRVTLPVSEAGVPVGRHPETGGALVRTGGAVVDLAGDHRYPLVAGATVLEETCEDCGLPLMAVERGGRFEVCLDRECDPLDEAVRERFDRAWSCPACGSDLRVIRRRGRLLAGCDAYPDCETAFTIPAGLAVDDCACGLPVFETATGRRCLDGTCERFPVTDDGGDAAGTAGDAAGDEGADAPGG